MAYSDYRRASRRRVCLICGKPDWCSYTPDENISFCARITEYANRISRTGWGVFYHGKNFSTSTPVPSYSKSVAKKPELAPLEIRDFAYRKLIELSPATNSEEIINGVKGLRTRKILDFENYGSLPQTKCERRKIAKHIRILLNQTFPDFFRRQTSSIAGIPGFWLDKNGELQLWTAKDYSIPLMLIPYYDAQGLIQACQLRFMVKAVKSRVKYIWLSTPEKNGSVSCGSPLYFASGFRESQLSGKPILITEGALKAQTIQNILSQVRVLANGGVTCSHRKIIEHSRFYPLFIAFDADYLSNQHVTRAFANLINLRQLDAEQYNYLPQLKILTWSPIFKGLDNALLKNLPISFLTIDQWLESLSQISKQKVLEIIQLSF